MQKQCKAAVEADKSREFGVLGDVLRELQKEELEYTEVCQAEIPDSCTIEKMLELLTEINKTLKEIAFHFSAHVSSGFQFQFFFLSLVSGMKHT